jgi:hypothetical protein
VAGVNLLELLQPVLQGRCSALFLRTQGGQALRQLGACLIEARALAGRLRRRLLLRQLHPGCGDGACQRALDVGHGLALP